MNIKINFQNTTDPLDAAFLSDSFLGFGPRGGGLSYGWVTEASAIDADGTSAIAVDTSAYPDTASQILSGGAAGGYLPQNRSFAYFSMPDYPTGATGEGDRLAWEVGLANGWYEVTVGVGNPGSTTGSYALQVEGASAVSFEAGPSARMALESVVVQVTDGFLTLTSLGSASTPIQFVDIASLDDLTPADGNPAPADYPSFSGFRAAAQDGSEVFETLLNPVSGIPTGVDPEADIFFGVELVAGRTGISLESLSDGSMKLYETLTGQQVAFSANTTAGADSVTLSPTLALKPNTSYTLEIDGALDRGLIEDSASAGREFERVATTFVTGEARPPVVGDVAFSDFLEIDGFADGGFGFTSIELSADGTRIFIANIVGEIRAFDLEPGTGAIDMASMQVFAPGGDFDTVAGRRGIIGLAVDPTDPDVLWITDNWPIPLDGRNDSVPEFSGRISKVTLGANGDLGNATVETYVRGLPRSNGDHVVNSLEFRANPSYDEASNPDVPQYLLYTMVGSNSAMGTADPAWGMRPERLLSATILEIDPTRTVPAGGLNVSSEPIPTDGLNRRFADTDGDLKNGGILIDSGDFTGNYLHFAADGTATVRAGADAGSTLVQSFYDPFAPDAIVSIFSTGQRNGYDLVWHSNGNLYAPTNGSAAGGNAPDDPSTPENEALTGIEIQPDYLFRVAEGGYYGHPNLLRNEYILNGGNPTAGVDPNEVALANGYDVGVQPEANYRIEDTYNLGYSRSPNGAIEYTSDVWGDALQGALIFTEYSGGNDLRAVRFDAQNNVVDDFVLRNFAGQPIDTYVDPLDVIVNPTTGQIYMITLDRASGESQLVRLDPTPPPTRLEVEDFTVGTGFVVKSNGNASAGAYLEGFGSSIQTAETTWDGPAGLYTISVGHFDENDGIASLGLRVDGVVVDVFNWDKELGSAIANSATATLENIPGVGLLNGSVIEIFGYRGNGDALRVDYVDVAFTAQTDGSEVAPVNAAPLSVSVARATSFAFTGAKGVSVADSDSVQVTTAITVTSGAVSVAGGSIDLIGNGTDTLYVSGSVSQVNDALSTLVFTPDDLFTGGVTLRLETSDGNGSDIDVIALSVDAGQVALPDLQVISRDPTIFDDRLHFSWIDRPQENASTPRDYKESATFTLRNNGDDTISVTGSSLNGPFDLNDPTVLDGLTLAAGESLDIQVDFDRSEYTPGGNDKPANFSGELTIRTASHGTATVQLAGLWQSKDEGSWEPNINEIWQATGFGNVIPGLPFIDTDPSPLNANGVYQAFDAFEVLSPYWSLADGATEATITHIAKYAGPGRSEIGIHRPFNKGSEAVSMLNTPSGSQTLFPENDSFTLRSGATIDPVFSSATFTNETIPDLWEGNDVFGIHVANFSMDASLNTIGTLPSDLPSGTVGGQWMRIFQALDADGNIIADTYLGVQDFSGSNGDYNDNLIVLEGIKPVSLTPVNTAPDAVAIGSQSTTFAFTGGNTLSISDPDGEALTRAKTFVYVENGTLSASGPATVVGDGTGVLSVSGSIAAINTTLASLVYTPDAGFSGEDTLTMRTNDPVLSDIDTVAISVTGGTGGPGTPSAPVRIEAETFTRDLNFRIATGSYLSGGEMLQAANSQEQVASIAFGLASGTYDISTSYFDENDGIASLEISVNGFAVDSWLWNQDLGSANANNGTRATRETSGVTINNGDVVSISGFKNSGEQLRIDYLDFTKRGDSTGPDTVSPLVQSAMVPDLGVAADGTATTRITVTYADNVALDVSSLDAGDLTVQGAGGILDVTGIVVDDSSDGTPRTVTYTVEAPGGTWDAGDDGRYTVSLNANEVFDVNGNAASSAVGIAGFDVALTQTPEPFRVEAETFTRVLNFAVSSNGAASGGQVLQAPNSQQQRASYEFAAQDGTYNVTLGYFDENDGQSSLAVLVNGAIVDEFLWNVDAAGATASPNAFVAREISGLSLETSDVIELVGTKDGGEPLRIDYLDFAFV